LADYWGRAAYYIDRLLKGAKPSELPIEQVSRFNLTINLRTAKAIGVIFPESVLVRADRSSSETEVTPNPRFYMDSLQRRCTCCFGAGYERSNGWHEGGGRGGRGGGSSGPATYR
jgi:hypothetical protein